MIAVDDVTGDLAAVDLAVHEVQAPQERGLAAAGRPDERGNLALVERERRVVQRVVVVVPHVDVVRVEDRLLDQLAAGLLARERIGHGGAGGSGLLGIVHATDP